MPDPQNPQGPQPMQAPQMPSQMGTMTPEQQQFLMSMMQRVGSQPQMPRLGGQNTQLPSGTAIPAVAKPGGAGIPMSAQPGYQPKGVSGHGIGMIPAAVMAIKQKSHQDKVQKARGTVNEWLAMQQNPDLQKKMDEMAKSDPKLAKTLESKKKDFVKMYDEAMKDPNSAAAQGVQLAYQDQQRQEEQKQSQQEFMQKMQLQAAQIQQYQALAAQEQARARDFEKLGATRGEVTPAEQYKQQSQLERTKIIIQAGIDKTVLGITNMNSRTQAKIASLEKIAGMREAGADKRSKARTAQAQAATAVLKQYKNIQSEISNLDREQKDLQDNIAKSPVTSWVTGATDEYQARSAAIESRRAALEGRLQQLDSSVDDMRQGNILPPDAGIPTPATSGATDQPDKTAQPKVHDFSQ